MKKIILCIFFSLFSAFSFLFSLSSDFLSDDEVSQAYLPEAALMWQKVLPGIAVSKPAPLSFGFCVISDAKKLSCISYEGRILWEKSVHRPKKSAVFELSDDFIVFSNVSEDSEGVIRTEVSLINPSGIDLWKSEIDFEVLKAFSSPDGRFFLMGKDKIICFGINGIKKWEKSLGSEINYGKAVFFDQDGCVYFSLEKAAENSKVRFSPFGHFEEDVIVSSGTENINCFKPEDSLGQNNSLNEKLCRRCLSKFFSGQNVLYAFLTEDLYLIVCRQDWNIECYSVFDSKILKKLPPELPQKKLKKSLMSFYNINDIWGKLSEDRDISSSERSQLLEQGNYGQKEIKYASEAINLFQKYGKEINSEDFRAEIIYSEYEANSKEFEKVIDQIALFSGSDFVNIAADFINHSKNPTVLKSTLMAVQKCGYDPEYKILSAIQQRSRRESKKNAEIICAMCDAVYAVCRFMGKDAYFAKGKQILADFLYTENTDKVKSYARRTFSRIKALEL